MKRYGIAPALLALLCLGIVGCASGPSPTVRVVKTELRDWENPEDGKTYLVVLPTWKVEGELPVAEVWGSGVITGNAGQVDFSKRDKPLYRADALDPGTTLHATHIPDDGLVVGVKDDVLAKTGENPQAEVYLIGYSEWQQYGSDTQGGAGP